MNMTIHDFDKIFLFRLKIIIFDKFQFEVFNLFNNAWLQSTVDQIILSKIKKIRLMNLQVIDIKQF